MFFSWPLNRRSSTSSLKRCQPWDETEHECLGCKFFEVILGAPLHGTHSSSDNIRYAEPKKLKKKNFYPNIAFCFHHFEARLFFEISFLPCFFSARRSACFSRFMNNAVNDLPTFSSLPIQRSDYEHNIPLLTENEIKFMLTTCLSYPLPKCSLNQKFFEYWDITVSWTNLQTGKVITSRLFLRKIVELCETWRFLFALWLPLWVEKTGFF